MVSLTFCTDICSALRFQFPSFTMDSWSQYNSELKANLGPLHFKLANNMVTPKEAGDLFSQDLSNFLSTKNEFTKEDNKSVYIENQSKSLEKSRKLKNTLRKKAFGKNGTDAGRKELKKAVKAHNYLKKLSKKRKNNKDALHQEKTYFKNFWKYAGKCSNGTLDQKPEQPTFSKDVADVYYPGKYSSPSPLDLTKLNWFPYLPVDTIDSSNQFNLSPIRPKDIRAIVNKKNATSAPGPDGIVYGIIKKLPSTHLILSTLFSKLLESGDPPESWSSSSVVLIYKSGDVSKPENFRMIALTSCVAKIYHQILAERMGNYLIKNGLIDSETQKAFLRGINGCAEHTTVMRELIAHSKAKKRTAHITFFDLADAFGSVEHSLIIHTLQRNGVPEPVIQYIERLYDSLKGTVKGPNWFSEPFRFKKGVFQGDPLSPIIFLAVFNPIIQHLKIMETQYGYNLNGTKYITLPFADDFV